MSGERHAQRSSGPAAVSHSPLSNLSEWARSGKRAGPLGLGSEPVGKGFSVLTASGRTPQRQPRQLFWAPFQTSYAELPYADVAAADP